MRTSCTPLYILRYIIIYKFKINKSIPFKPFLNSQKGNWGKKNADHWKNPVLKSEDINYSDKFPTKNSKDEFDYYKTMGFVVAILAFAICRAVVINYFLK